MKFKNVPTLSDFLTENFNIKLDEATQIWGTTKTLGLSDIDPKKAADAVKTGFADGEKKDDAFKGKKKLIAVGDLKPAQTEIIKEKAFGMAIGMLLKGNWEDLDLGSIISKDNYIMDGHHRWAGVSLIDPKAKLEGTVIDLPGTALVSVLNIITVGELGITGGNPGKGNVADFTGKNFEKIIESAVEQGLPGEFPISKVDVIKALSNMPGANGDWEKGAEIMCKNADKLPKKIMTGAPARVEMPVISPEMVTKVQKMIDSGEIDVTNPYAS